MFFKSIGEVGEISARRLTGGTSAVSGALARPRRRPPQTEVVASCERRGRQQKFPCLLCFPLESVDVAHVNPHVEEVEDVNDIGIPFQAVGDSKIIHL